MGLLMIVLWTFSTICRTLAVFSGAWSLGLPVYGPWGSIEADLHRCPTFVSFWVAPVKLAIQLWFACFAWRFLVAAPCLGLCRHTAIEYGLVYTTWAFFCYDCGEKLHLVWVAVVSASDNASVTRDARLRLAFASWTKSASVESFALGASRRRTTRSTVTFY